MVEISDLIQHNEIRLPEKPNAALQYSYVLSDTETHKAPLVVFINGLVLPQSGWSPTINTVIQQCSDRGKTRPVMLSYDRYGQGLSDPDPTDQGKPDGHTHDLNDAARDLGNILEHFTSRVLPNSDSQPISAHNDRLVIFVCNSIGCPLARLFAQQNPDVCSAFIFLDSMMANTDFVSMFPDPDAVDFERGSLPAGLTEEDIRNAREIYQRYFHPTVPNRERLNRSNAAQLLPYSDKPVLGAPCGWGPLLTVVGHDWDVFAAENKRSFNLPEAICHEYINPYWHRYNQGLTMLTGKEQWSEGPIIARGCGHFIQRDDPDFVAMQISQTLDRLDEMVKDGQSRDQNDHDQ